MSKPLVSVIIPCYNAEKFVEQAVRSIMEQTYQNLEIICINDCSKDNTGEILQKLAKEDSRIVYVNNEVNLKLPKTLNKGIALAKGEYIARMDADDISLPERIEKQIQFMLLNENIDIVGCNSQHIDSNNNVLNYRTFLPTSPQIISFQMPFRCVLIHPAILAKKTFFVDMNGFNESLVYAEDYELWVRAVAHNKKISNLDGVLLQYRIHNNQSSAALSSQYNSEQARINRNFLFRCFLKTKNIKFLFGILIQTKIIHFIIIKTSSCRNSIKEFFK